MAIGLADINAPTPAPPQRWKQWAACLAIWSAVGLFFGARVSLLYTRVHRGPDLLMAPEPRWWFLAQTIFAWLLWGALSLPVLGVVRWTARETQSHSRRTLLTVASGAAFVSLHILLSTAFSHALAPVSYSGGSLGRMLGTNALVSGPWDIATFAILVFLAHALENRRRIREREIEALRLEAKLTHAELALLRSKLDPHFLFNSLHAISVLIREDPGRADRMLQSLSRLLRHSFENAGLQEVALSTELEFVREYLEIQRIRFSDRLATRLEAEEGLDGALVPNFILQPLVENSIRHGLEPRARRGRVEVLARSRNGRLELRIQDNGAGLPAGPLREGLGLSNTRARLEHLYGSDHRFRIERGALAGVVATIELPLHRAGEAGRSPGTPSHENPHRRRRTAGA
jgi:two-component system LytT family sensor kinase